MTMFVGVWSSYDVVVQAALYRRQVLYCAIPKAASTTWKTTFAVATRHPLTSSITEHQAENTQFMRRIGLRFLSSYSSDDVTRKLATYRKMVVVRHPLSRLVSAYTDKIARVNAYGNDIRRKIITMTSRHHGNASSHFQHISFAQFIRFFAWVV